MTVEETLRAIVREELERVLRAPSSVAGERQKWHSARDAAKHLGISPRTLAELVSRGLPHIQPGEYRRFNLEECEAWIRGRAQDVCDHKFIGSRACVRCGWVPKEAGHAAE